MGKYQKGTIYKTAAGKFFVRYDAAPVNGKRRQVSEFLHVEDATHYMKKSKGRVFYSGPLQTLRDEVMQKVNSGTGSGTSENLNSTTVTNATNQTSITEFWETRFLPFTIANKKPSTVTAYGKLWKYYLSDHFTGKTFQEYRRATANNLLTELQNRNLSQQSVSNVRNLAQAFFKYFMDTDTNETLHFNPWTGAKALGKFKATKKPPVYTLEEVKAILLALSGHVMYQLIMALSCFEGMRPGEISALKWEDFGVRAADAHGRLMVIPGTVRKDVHIRRALWKRNIGTPKKETSGVISVVAPVQNVLTRWWTISGEPTTGWVFPNRITEYQGQNFDVPQNVINTQKYIKDILKKKEVKFKGLYAGRRAAATLLTELTGNALAAKEILRHKDLTTTTQYYIQPLPQAEVEGMKMLESKIGNLLLEGTVIEGGQ